MDIVNVEGFTVQGLRLRTQNALEMDPSTATIPAHVALVDANITIDYRSGARPYSVYCEYESDVNGEFDVVMGSNNIAASKLPLESVEIQAGQYMKFTKEGEFPDAIIQAWQEVWQYFSASPAEHSRAYTTDFEHYEGPNKVSVYIALKDE